MVTTRSGNVASKSINMQVSDVAVIETEYIRKQGYSARVDIVGGTSHRSVRAHIRRGHWHSYWVGKRNEPETRKLVLRFLMPTMVNASENELPIVCENINHVIE